MPGMAKMRVDMIVVASVLIDYLCNAHEFQRVRVSRYALKEGAMARLFEE
jgi:exopolyphosphatase/guanosine-5'-triphosphate,3'-diphosphate pyrophosphatase